MAKSITFKGTPKPFGASGHFDEPTRHSLQAKGIRTGNLADSPAVYEKWGITNLEGTPTDYTPRTSTGLEDIEAEAKASKQPPKESLSAKFKKMEQQLAESMKRERKAKESKKRKEMFEAVGKEPPEEKEATDDEFGSEDFDAESVPAKVGHFLADLTEDYSSEDMVGLNNKELEMLAVRFHAQTRDSMFGEPENPFVSEIKKRMEAEAELSREKAQIRAEISSPQHRERGLLADIFTDEPETPTKERKGEGKGLIQDIFGE